MSDPIIKKRLDELSTEYREFVTSDFPVELTAQFSKYHNLDEDGSTILETGLVLYLLFFFDRSRFQHFLLENISLAEGEVTELIEAMLLLIPEDIKEDIVKTYKMYESVPTTTSIKLEQTQSKKISEDTPEVTPLRTMSNDMQKVHGYGALRKANEDHQAEQVHTSDQTETLQKKSLTDLPTYTESKE